MHKTILKSLKSKNAPNLKTLNLPLAKNCKSTLVVVVNSFFPEAIFFVVITFSSSHH